MLSRVSRLAVNKAKPPRLSPTSRRPLVSHIWSVSSHPKRMFRSSSTVSRPPSSNSTLVDAQMRRFNQSQQTVRKMTTPSRVKSTETITNHLARSYSTLRGPGQSPLIHKRAQERQWNRGNVHKITDVRSATPPSSRSPTQPFTLHPAVSAFLRGQAGPLSTSLFSYRHLKRFAQISVPLLPVLPFLRTYVGPFTPHATAPNAPNQFSCRPAPPKRQYDVPYLKFAKLGDEVVFNYTARLVDGTVIDSTTRRKKPMRIFVGADHNIIPGLDRALQLIPVGQKAKAVIPFDEAYGIRGIPGVVPPFATIFYDIEMLQIKGRTREQYLLLQRQYYTNEPAPESLSIIAANLQVLDPHKHIRGLINDLQEEPGKFDNVVSIHYDLDDCQFRYALPQSLELKPPSSPSSPPPPSSSSSPTRGWGYGVFGRLGKGWSSMGSGFQPPKQQQQQPQDKTQATSHRKGPSMVRHFINMATLLTCETTDNLGQLYHRHISPYLGQKLHPMQSPLAMVEASGHPLYVQQQQVKRTVIHVPMVNMAPSPPSSSSSSSVSPITSTVPLLAISAASKPFAIQSGMNVQYTLPFPNPPSRLPSPTTTTTTTTASDTFRGRLLTRVQTVVGMIPSNQQRQHNHVNSTQIASYI